MTETPAKTRRISKSAMLKMRVSPSERQAIEDRARRAGLTVSEYARRRCLNAPAITAKTPAASDAEALRLLLIAGNNLNQIARRLNAGRGVQDVALSATLTELQDAIRGLAER